MDAHDRITATVRGPRSWPPAHITAQSMVGPSPIPSGPPLCSYRSRPVARAAPPLHGGNVSVARFHLSVPTLRPPVGSKYRSHPAVGGLNIDPAEAGSVTGIRCDRARTGIDLSP